MKIKSDFVLLDVRSPQKKLEKIVSFDYNKEKKVPVKIIGFISNAWGDSDGTSQEFEVEVTLVEAGDPVDVW